MSGWVFGDPQIKAYRSLISEEKAVEIHQLWAKMLMGVRPAIPEETAMPLLGNPSIYYACHTSKSGLLAGEDRGFLVTKGGDLQKMRDVTQWMFDQCVPNEDLQMIKRAYPPVKTENAESGSRGD